MVTRRHWLYILISATTGLGLIRLLFAVAKIDWTAATEPLLRLQLRYLTLFVLLLGINAFLAGEKWRLVERRLRNADGTLIPRPLYFALTAIALPLSLVMPSQLSASLSRSLGSHFYGGRAIVRGTAATFFEQSFDLLVAVFVSIASVSVLLFGGGATDWLLLAGIFSMAGLITTGPGIRFAVRCLTLLKSLRFFAQSARMSALANGLLTSSVLSPSLGRRLFLLSLLRLLALMWMMGFLTAAAGLDIPLWQLSAAVPVVMVAVAVPITPAGLGVNEWVFASILVLLGNPFDLAAQVVVINRILGTVAFVIVGVAGGLVGAGTLLALRGWRNSQTVRRRVP